MRIAFDIDLMRPGCAIVQAALGCGYQVALAFPSETWLTHLTPGMKTYEISADQLRQLVAKVTIANDKQPLN